MDLGLKDKGVIVTGASKGIGLAIAEGFAREGAKVSVCARGPEALEQARERLAGHGGVVHAARCDVGDGAAMEAYLAAAHKALRAVHVLVNNPSGFGDTDDEKGWAVAVDIDLLALARATRMAAPMIEAAGGGSVIHISSISGLEPTPESPPLWRGQGGGHPPHHDPGQVVGGEKHPGQLRRPGGRSSSPAAPGKTSRRIIPITSTRWSPAFPSAAWARPRKSPTAPCSWPPSRPAGSPARPSPSTAASCFKVGV